MLINILVMMMLPVAFGRVVNLGGTIKVEDDDSLSCNFNIFFNNLLTVNMAKTTIKCTKPSKAIKIENYMVKSDGFIFTLSFMVKKSGIVKITHATMKPTPEPTRAAAITTTSTTTTTTATATKTTTKSSSSGTCKSVNGKQCLLSLAIYGRKITSCSSYKTDGALADKPWCLTDLNINSAEVCGPDCPGVEKEDMTNMAPENEEGECTCGIRNANSKRIVNGENAMVAEFPWQVALLPGNKNVFLQSCGGTLVGEKHVVTAAHCVYNLAHQFVGKENIKVLVGATNLLVANESTKESVQRYIMDLEEVRVHPWYMTPTTYSNDIAVLVFKEPVSLTKHPNIKPACLPFKDFKIDGTGHITGWGVDESGKFTTAELQKAVVKILWDKCMGEKVEVGGFCAQGKDKNGFIDACQGDSGGPLVVENVELGNRYELLGITSYGQGCALSDKPGFYANVFHYLNIDGWLKLALKDGKTCGGHPIIPEGLPQSLMSFKFKEVYISQGQCKQMCLENPKCVDWMWKDAPENLCKMFPN